MTIPYPSPLQRKLTTSRFLYHSSSSISRSSSLFQQQPRGNYDAILESIDEVFPPNLLNQRIALSRKDGYWPFISTGEDPPQEFVYGEFDVEFFCHAIDKARELHPDPQVFCDLGSGTGRLVLVAAALHPSWKLVRGIELLPGIHEQAVAKLDACRRSRVDDIGSNTPATSGVSPSVTSTMGGVNEQTVSSGSELDAYWKQYKPFSAPSPNDDWLNQLSNSFNDNDEDDEEKDTTLTDGGLYLPNTNTNQDDSSIANDNTGDMQAYSTTDDNGTTQAGDYALGSKHQLPLAPIQLSCGSFDDPYEFFGDADIIFCFSSAMPYHIMIEMARAVGRQCKEGTLVLTTEYRLPEGGTIDPIEKDSRVPFGSYELELVEELNGTNEATGGESTVFVHRVVKSVGIGHPISRPEPNVSDMCYDAIQHLQKNDPQRFLRQVSNQMMFLGLPDSWLPKLDSEDDASMI